LNLSELTFILTDDCNFRCRYCYKIKSKNFLDYSTAVDFLNFFWPYLNDNANISFYGGEPLLSFSLIKKIVDIAENKKGEFHKEINFSISANGEIWGCPLFSDYFDRIDESSEREKYCFGTLEEFSKDYDQKYSKVLQNYSELRMDHYSTPDRDCFLCPDLEYCSVCPVSSSLSGYPLKKIPDFVCKIQKIKIHEILRFFRKFR
jgi:sulfatase maturation enzyme AslB (radical SAM superfamily)